MSSGERAVEYEAAVEYYGRLDDQWRVCVVRRTRDEDGCEVDVIRRCFWLRWSALRFANSQRRILKAFREYDRREARVEVFFTRPSGEGGQSGE